MAKLLQGRPLYIRKKIAAIATGIIAIILVLLMVYIYTHHQNSARDPEPTIVGGYTTIIDKIQSLFHRK